MQRLSQRRFAAQPVGRRTARTKGVYFTGLQGFTVSPSKAAMVSAAMLASGVSLAQDSGPQPVVVNSPQTYQLGHSPLNEPQSLARLPEAEPRHFTIPWGSGGFNVSAGLKGEYVDNVYLTEHQLKDDFIVI